jgi:hypothetical protein
MTPYALIVNAHTIDALAGRSLGHRRRGRRARKA